MLITGIVIDNFKDTYRTVNSRCGDSPSLVLKMHHVRFPEVAAFSLPQFVLSYGSTICK